MPLPAEVPTALVADPEYLIAAAVEDLLREHGYRVAIAQGDHEVARYLNSAVIDVAVLDFTAYGVGENCLAQRLAALGIPVVFCTAFELEAVMASSPGVPVVAKPLRDAELLAALQIALVPFPQPLPVN